MLEEIDIEILKFINKFGKVSKDSILNAFPESKFSTSFRISYLEEPEYKNLQFGLKIPIENTSYIKSIYEHIKDEHGGSYTNKLEIYHLTDLGKAFIQNYIRESINKRKEFRQDFFKSILQNIFCPIIVSVITTLLTYWITKTYNLF
nr:MAG TPA: Toxin Fst, type I toxin-antitoxin system [Caudoviricetes sp.]